MRVTHLLSVALLLSAVAGCDSTSDPVDEWSAPTVPLLHAISFSADAAPAVGDTAQFTAAFRFVQATDGPFIAENRFDQFVDSLYTIYGPLRVEGGIKIYPYLDHSAPSSSARIVGGESTFAGRVTPADTIRLSADVLALRSDRLMAAVTLNVYVDRSEGTEAAIGGGFKHSCFVVEEESGLSLGDCWDTTPE